jgi:hypothetical protein
MMRTLEVLVVLAWVVGAVLSDSPIPGCQGGLPAVGVWDSPPVLVNQTTYGKLFTVGGPENPVLVLHLYGSPYQMGQAHGLLLKDNILKMYSEFYDYIDSQVSSYFKYLPEFLRKMIENGGINLALEYEVILTHDYVADYFNDEIRGLADAIGLSYELVKRFQMFPELIKAECSIVGAWGEATPTEGLFHLRALDWGTVNPFRQYPTLFVYHPQPGNGHAFASLGFNGVLGALTGFSPYVGAGEKVWIHYNGTDVRAGIPWNFLFRDILQFDQNVSAALDRINSATRTCAIFLGLGDHTEPSDFKVVEYSHDRVEVFSDDTPFPGYAPTPAAHPFIPGVAYVDKHSQPSSDPCLGNILQKYHGIIDAEALINVTSLSQTGDMHAAVFDYGTNTAYIAVASQTVPFPVPDPTSVLPAYSRPFIKLDMNTLFAT